eukprot:757076-Hanusia_phi.AAC.6
MKQEASMGTMARMMVKMMVVAMMLLSAESFHIFHAIPSSAPAQTLPCRPKQVCALRSYFHAREGTRALSLPAYMMKKQSSWHTEEEPESSDSSEGIRINKCFKQFASRRESDRFIEEGRVTVDGRRALPGDRVFPGNIVKLDGKVVQWQELSIIDESVAPQEQFVYIKYWKPRGIVCTTDTRVRGNIVDAVGHPERIFMVGRLDKDSTGLILLTSDGRIPNFVLRSERKHDKKYLVRTDRPIRAEDIRKLAEGVVITTVAQRDRKSKAITARTLPCEVARTSPDVIRITLHEGRNRQIRKMLEALGYEVVDLHRVEVMGITLEGLRVGEWQALTDAEVSLITERVHAQLTSHSLARDILAEIAVWSPPVPELLKAMSAAAESR